MLNIVAVCGVWQCSFFFSMLLGECCGGLAVAYSILSAWINGLFVVVYYLLVLLGVVELVR